MEKLLSQTQKAVDTELQRPDFFLHAVRNDVSANSVRCLLIWGDRMRNRETKLCL